MTPQEMLNEIERRKALGHKYIVLRVGGARRGARARVLPGCMGRVLGATDNGEDTFVDVQLGDIERALRKSCTCEGVGPCSQAECPFKG